MSTLYQQSEATSAYRKFTFVCVDDTDGKTPETGLTFSGSEVSVRKAAGTYAAVSGIASITEIGDGEYEGTFTATELDTLGPLHLKIKKTGVRTVIMYVGQVVPWDPFDSVRLGMTALPNGTAGDPLGNGLPILHGSSASGFVFSDGVLGLRSSLTSFEGSGLGLGTYLPVNVMNWRDSVVNLLSSGRVDASVGAMANDVVTAAAIADNAIDAGAIAANAITSAKIASGAITATQIASGAITATQIAANAIGASQIAASAITSAKFASGAITSTVIATDAIGSAQLATTAVTEIQSGLATSAALSTVAGYLDTEVAAILAAVDTEVSDIKTRVELALPNAAPNGPLGLIVSHESSDVHKIYIRTGGYASSRVVSIDSAATADIADGVWDEPLSGHTTVGSAGKQLADVAVGTPPSASAIADAVWDEALSGHSTAGSAGKYVQDIKTKTDLIPADPATITKQDLILSDTAYLTTEVGNTTTALSTVISRLPTSLVSGRIKAHVEGMASDTLTASAIAANAITSAKIAANAITSSQIATDAIGANQIAANAITSAKIATDAIGASQIAAGAIDASALATDAVQEIADAVWDEDLSGHVTSGSAGEALTDAASGAGGGGGPTAAAIADAVWDEARAGHVSPGTFGEGINIAALSTDAISAASVSAGAVTKIQTGLATATAQTTLQTTATTIDTKIGTPAGASVSADVAAVSSKIGTPTGVSVSADVASVKSDTSSTLATTNAIATDVNNLEKVALGKWKIQGTQLILYEADGTTPFRTFNLLDDTGAPSNVRIFERTPA